MKKICSILLVLLFVILPFKVNALSSNYVDKVAEIVEIEPEENKINLYLFHSSDCPHCKEERKWLENFKEKYKDVLNVYEYEVNHDMDNAALMELTKMEFGLSGQSVPFTVVGDSFFSGYSSATASRIESKVLEYLYEDVDQNGEANSSNGVDIPILGKVDLKSVSIPLVAIILGFIDGFNPCAMWILLFLISMLFKMNNKKKAWILGLTFLFISALVYFLSMIGINFVLSVVAGQWLKIAIAIFILIAGILNLRKYLKIRKEEAGCSVIDDKKRKGLIKRIRSIIDNNNFILALFGIIILAATVNLIELACSLGFPVIFNEILTVNNIKGFIKIVYLLLYIFFYMLDDLVVFAISMVTLEATGITNKYNKLCTLISAIIMIIMGLLLIFKPEWIMFNF